LYQQHCIRKLSTERNFLGMSRTLRRPVKTSPTEPKNRLQSLALPTVHQCPYFFSPASMRTGRRFSFGGSGQVAYGVNAQGGL